MPAPPPPLGSLFLPAPHPAPPRPPPGGAEFTSAPGAPPHGHLGSPQWGAGGGGAEFTSAPGAPPPPTGILAPSSGGAGGGQGAPFTCLVQLSRGDEGTGVEA